MAPKKKGGSRSPSPSSRDGKSPKSTKSKKKERKQLTGEVDARPAETIDEWMCAALDENIDKMTEMLMSKVVTVNERVPQRLGGGLKGTFPIGTPKDKQHVVRWYEGDTALHFVSRHSKRETIIWLVAQNAAKDGDEWRNSRGEDPREVCQTIDQFTDASATGDFEPLEPLLDPYETIYCEMANGDVFDIPIRIIKASPLASTAYIEITADTVDTIKHKIYTKKAIPPKRQRILYRSPAQPVQVELTKGPGEKELNDWGIKDQEFIVLAEPPGTINVQYEGYEQNPDPDADSGYQYLPGHKVFCDPHTNQVHDVELIHQRIRDIEIKADTVGWLREGQHGVEGITKKYLVPHYEEGELKIPGAFDADSMTEENPEGLFNIVEDNHSFEDYSIGDGATIVMRPPGAEPPEPEEYIEKENVEVEVVEKVEEVLVKSYPNSGLWPREREIIGAAGAACIKVRYTKTLDRVPQPPPPEAATWRGVELLAYGEQSMQIWEEAIAKDPQDSYAHRRLGRAMEAGGWRASAIAHYRIAIDIDPEYNYAKRDLAMALAGDGKRDEAMELLQGVLMADPNYCQAYCDLGDILTAEQDWDGAMWHYQCAIDRDIDYETSTSTPVIDSSYRVSALRGIGLAHLARGQREDGLANLREALEICPEDRLTTYHLALAEGRDEDLTNQVESWEYHSDRGMANGNLMQASMACRAADMADMYRKAHKKKPDDEHALLRMGAALYCSQDSDWAHGSKQL